MLTPDQIETSRKELAELERKFLERVAQTNRSKTAGVKGEVPKIRSFAKTCNITCLFCNKEGKGGYEDENGNPIMAPWMVPPDDSGELSARAAHHLANRGSQGTFPSDHSTYSNVSVSSCESSGIVCNDVLRFVPCSGAVRSNGLSPPKNALCRPSRHARNGLPPHVQCK